MSSESAAGISPASTRARPTLTLNTVCANLTLPPATTEGRVVVSAAVPLGVPVYAVHGTEDDTVPVSQSETYAGAAKAAGAPVQLLKVPGDHFALIDPKAPAYRKCRELVQQLLV